MESVKNIKSVETNELESLWDLFTEYHSEVSIYSGERPLPSKDQFTSFWASRDKHSVILYSGSKPIGFALMQHIVTANCFKYLEVGAIFVKKEHRRGYNGIKLYKAIMNYGITLDLPIGSEIAEDNNVSISIARLLAKRNIRRQKKGFLRETRLKNGRRCMIYYT